MTKIEVGSCIPLIVQVYDKRADLTVTAKLIDNIGIVLKTVELFSYGDGLYMNQECEMPDVRYVVAQYFIEPDEYQVSSDTFFAIPKPGIEEIYIVGSVEKRAKFNEFIIGVVTNETKD